MSTAKERLDAADIVRAILDAMPPQTARDRRVVAAMAAYERTLRAGKSIEDAAKAAERAHRAAAKRS